MNWFEFTLLFIFFIVIAALINKKTLNVEKIDEIIYGASIQLITGIICLFFAFREGFSFVLSFQTWPMILGMTITNIVALSLFYTGLKKIDLSQETILSSTGSVWSLLLGAILLSEKITTLKLTGVLIIILACMVLVWEKKIIYFGKYQLFILASAIFYAAGAVWDKQLNSYGTPFSYIAISFGIVGFSMLMFYFRRTLAAFKITFRHKEFWKSAIITGFLYSAGFWSLFSAYQAGGEVSRMFPMTLSTSVFVPILGMLLLKEHKQWLQKTLAISILVFGLWLIKG